ncbi:hypothetical protein LY85_1420 [Clostridium sp. KNHs216]|nr:hypothetical protein LY85_1420 [Clostridium sp. KNHs216]
MLYKIRSRGNYAHLWNFEQFRQEVDGEVADYELNGNVIQSITYRVQTAIPQHKLDEYLFIGEPIEE